MPKISIVPAATLLSGIMVVIVATVTLSISYFTVFDSIRNVARVTTESMAQTSVLKVNDFLSAPLETGREMQRMLRMQNFTLPRDDPDTTPNWRHKWVNTARWGVVAKNYSHNSIALGFADNALIRGFTSGDAIVVITSVVNNPVNTVRGYDELIDQLNMTTFQPTHLPLDGVLFTPKNVWETPVIPVTRILSNNFTIDFPSYYFSTQHIIGKPDGTLDVIAATHTMMHNSQGDLLGLIALSFNMHELEAVLDTVKITSGTEVFVMRHTKSIVATTHELKSPNRTLLPADFNFSVPAHPDCHYPDWETLTPEAWFMNCQVQTADHPYAPLRHFGNTKAYDEIGTTAVFNTYSVGSDVYYIVGQKLVYEGANFTVLLVMPESDVLSEVVTVRNLSLVLSAVLAVVCCIITAITLHFMLRPLSEMCSRLSETAKFKLESDTAVVRWSSVKEIFDLQCAYREMSDQLRLVKRFVPHSMFATGGGAEDSSEYDSKTTQQDSDEYDSKTTQQDSDTVDMNSDVFDDLHAHVSDVGSAVLINPLAAPPPEAVHERILLREPNKFRRRDCTVICLLLSSPSGDTKEQIEKTSKAALWRAIQVIDANKGVVDQLRPDVFVATFNAHSRCVMHRQIAVKAALTLAWSLQHEVFDVKMQFGIAVDAGEHLVGTCGSEDHRANVVLGNAFDNITALAAMARDRYLSTVIATDVVTKGLSGAVAVCPIDVLDVKGTRKAVFEVTAGQETKLEVLEEAFANIRQGKGTEAATTLRTLVNATEPNTPLRFRADMMLQLAESITPGQQYLRCYNSYRWVFSKAEESVVFNFATDNSDRYALPSIDEGESSKTTSSNIQLTTTSHDTVGEKLQKALEFQSLPDDDSLFPMFHQPEDTKKTGEGGDFPETVVDTNQITWQVAKKVLGRGAAGAVILGLGEDGSYAALKFVPIFDGAKSPQDLQHEVLTLSELEHENVTHYVSCAISDTYFVLITEFIPGGSLADSISSFGKLPPKLLRRYAIEILQGLAYLHEKAIVHCDVKPQNILVTAEGSCKLSDFGSALALRATGTGSSAVVVRGTAWFMAPEVARGGTLLPAADIWSFGITMLMLDLGRLPFARLEGVANSPTNFMSALANGEFKFNFKREALCPAVQIIADKCLILDERSRSSASNLLAMVS